MYGYSWIKPAGCPKTMLGMREEQLEREEVERQMREAEMQERMAGEAEEMERRMEREAEGDMAGVEERDLDDEVPEHEREEEGGWGSGGSELGEEGEVGMEGDLDDDIPEAEEQSEALSDEEMTSELAAQDSPARNDWTYDTRREPDTEEEESGDEALRRIRRTARMAREARQQGYQRTPGAPGSDYDVDERDAEALALAEEMLDEDEMADVSDGDEHEHDLDDSVPDAEEGEWEHTDSDGDGDEDIEEEMDISIMPVAAQPSTRRSDGLQYQHQPPSSGARGTRVVSGNAALSTTNRSSPVEDSSSAVASSRARRGVRSQAQLRNPSFTAAQQGSGYTTPVLSGQQAGGRGIPRTSMLLATESSVGTAEEDSIMGEGQVAADGNGNGRPNGHASRTGWLNPASARRNLFGMSRGAGSASAGNSSGGLFTPEGQGQGQASAGAGVGAAGDFETPVAETPATGTGRQTRSGRLLAGLGRRGRRAEET
jgi:hypothetical protein